MASMLLLVFSVFLGLLSGMPLNTTSSFNTTVSLNSTGLDMTGIFVMPDRVHVRRAQPSSGSLDTIPATSPTTCFNNCNGYAHQWMIDLAAGFCDQIDQWIIDDRDMASAVWYTFRQIDTCQTDLGAGDWQCTPPNGTLLEVGINPDLESCQTKVSSEACREAFALVTNGCNTNTLDGKQGGQYMGSGESRDPADCLFFTIDPAYSNPTCKNTGYATVPTGEAYSIKIPDEVDGPLCIAGVGCAPL